MTPEYQAELKQLKADLKSQRCTIAQAKKVHDAVYRIANRTLTKAIKAAERAARLSRRTADKDEAAIAKPAYKTIARITDRIAVLEGRLS